MGWAHVCLDDVDGAINLAKNFTTDCGSFPLKPGKRNKIRIRMRIRIREKS